MRYRILRKADDLAHINKVFKSIETDDCRRCVDLFIRPNGSYGFEEYRRDPEEGQGWYPIGHFAGLVFQTEEDVRDNAYKSVHWLNAL